MHEIQELSGRQVHEILGTQMDVLRVTGMVKTNKPLDHEHLSEPDEESPTTELQKQKETRPNVRMRLNLDTWPCIIDANPSRYCQMRR